MKKATSQPSWPSFHTSPSTPRPSLCQSRQDLSDRRCSPSVLPQTAPESCQALLGRWEGAGRRPGEGSILVSLGCYNKMSQSSWFENNRNQEAGSPRSGSQHGWVLVVNSKRYFQKISVPVLWCGRSQAEHVGVERKESFMKGRGITGSARWKATPRWEKTGIGGFWPGEGGPWARVCSMWNVIFFNESQTFPNFSLSQGEPLFLVVYCPLLVVASRGKNRVRDLSVVPFIRALTPFMRDPPSRFNLFPKTLPPNAITFDIRFQPVNSGKTQRVYNRCLWTLLQLL
jgi:hypothetical protein